MAKLKVYTTHSGFLPRVVLDVLGQPSHIQQGTVWVVSTSIVKAAELLANHKISGARGDVKIAMGYAMDEAKRVGLLETEGTIVATTSWERPNDPVVRVGLTTDDQPLVTLLGFWRKRPGRGYDRMFEHAAPPKGLVDKLSFLNEKPALIVPDSVRCPGCFRTGVRITKDGSLYGHNKLGTRKHCDSSGMSISLMQGLLKAGKA